MTETEKNTIVAEVLSALRTNSRTIEQLTPVSSLSATDSFEISGGRRVEYATITRLIKELSEDEHILLQEAIDKNELQSVTILTTGNSAVLSIKSAGKTIQCAVPVASATNAGIITQADLHKIETACTTADTACNLAKKAGEDIQQINEDIQSFIDTKGEPDGLASLDSYGVVPESQLPKVVCRFHSIISVLSISQSTSLKKSTDIGCRVVFDPSRNCFLLGVSSQAVEGGEIGIDTQSDTIAIIPDKIGGIGDGSIIGVPNNYTYYAAWGDADDFGTRSGNGVKPTSTKIYICTSEERAYYLKSSGTLTAIGDEGAGGSFDPSLYYTKGEVDALTERTDEDLNSIGDEVRELDTKHAADTDAIRRDFIGVWDEIDHVKELLASVATNEVRDCLRQLKFDDDAINDYIYFNLHGYCNVTMDELRLSAWRWTHRDELEALPELYVLPHFSDEEWGKVRYLSDMFQPRHSVKYVSYWWNDSFSPYGGDGVLASNCFVANLFVANLKYQSGEFTHDATLDLNYTYQFYNINGYIEKVHGQGYWAHLDTIADTITFNRGALSGRTIKGSEPFVSKLRPYLGMFYYATIEDAKIGTWDLSDSDPGLQSFEGAIIKNSDIALDFAGGTAQYKLFYQSTLINSKINLMNLRDEFWSGPYISNGVLDALVDSNVGGGAESVTTITSDIDGRVYVDNIPCASAAECGAVIYDMPNLDMAQIKGDPLCTKFEDDVEYRTRWGHYWRCFLKNIGANIGSSLYIYQMFSLTTTNPDMQPAVQNNLELFIESSRTWYDRTAAGLDAVSLFVTRKFMNLLPDEEKAMLVNKGYRLVEIDESFYAQ